MSKLTEIIADLAAVDAMSAPRAETIYLRQKVRSLEIDRERIDDELRAAVRDLDALDAQEDPAKKDASAYAVAIVAKHGKSIAELRAIVAAVT